MNMITDTKQDRINLRLRHDVKKTLERAAGFEGKTISSFILSSALVQAEKTISEHEIIRLNSHDSEAFFDALAQPIQFNDKLLRALTIHSQSVESK